MPDEDSIPTPPGDAPNETSPPPPVLPASSLQPGEKLSQTTDNPGDCLFTDPPPLGHKENPFVSGPSVPGIKEHWDMLRGAVIHEDNLINHRLTWLLAAHAFLFAGFGVVQTAALGEKISPLVTTVLEALLILLFLCACCLCRIVGFAVALAGEHMCHLRCWWMEAYKDEARAHIVYPPPKEDNGTTTADNKKKVMLWPFEWLGGPHFEYPTPTTAKRPEPPHVSRTLQPPLLGTFKTSPWVRTSTIPAVVMMIDLLLILASGGVILIAWNRESPKTVPQMVPLQIVNLEYERADGPTRIRATLQLDSQNDPDLEILKSLKQSLKPK